MRKILFSLMVIGIASTMLGAGTMSYFSDTEIAAGNTFTAGQIDLKINCHSTHSQDWPGHGQYVEDPIIFEEKDLVEGDKIFDWSDIKPGDYGEATISIHVYDNDAYIWLKMTNVEEDGGVLTEPEESDYGPTDDGELSKYMEILIWKDWGLIPGWQGQIEDPQEGDNIWQECYEPVMYEGTMEDFLYEQVIIGGCHIEACTTYYLGWAWWVPVEVDNIIQGDSLSFDLEFYAEQYRNNPNPTGP